jgi:hypothetical protein
MSDDELEAACRPGAADGAPWAYWTSEHYSFGKCLRAYTGFPRWLPLFVYADHGVGLNSNLYPHELANTARVHLTTLRQKAERYAGQAGRRVVHVPHPWIHYRRAVGIERHESPRGTLAFFTHHVPGLKWENHDTERYFELLRSLPPQFHPLVICLHMHDVNAGMHRDLRRQGFPLVTAGHTSSPRFVDRFYGIVRGFAYGTSQIWGSQTAYCVEMGIPYFFLGERPRLVNLDHKDWPPGEVRLDDEVFRTLTARSEALFGEPVAAVTGEQRDFAAKALGLDSTITPQALAGILRGELLHHWREWGPLWARPLAQALRKHGPWGVVRKIAHDLRGPRS